MQELPQWLMFDYCSDMLLLYCTMSKLSVAAKSALFPIWLFRSKVHPTKQKVEMLSRPSLVKTLNEGLERKLTVVSAPAGYGKSTLLAEWRGELVRSDTRVCWLSLDNEDNDFVQLLTYIAFSLFEGDVDFGAAGITDDSFFKDVSPRNFLSILSHIIDVQNEKIVMVLDDFESLEENSVNTVIKPFLEYAPPNLHLAVATRDHSNLKIANLDAQGLVGRIHINKMQFTKVQISDFFDGRLNKNTLSQVYQLTEGWPVTVQMIKNFFEKDRNVDKLLANFSRQPETITTYLSEQILEDISPGLQIFLMEISLLDRASIESANFLRESGDSATWFKKCEPLSGLVLPLEQVKDTFRLHPLFREYLYGLMLTTNPQRANELHLRISSWFAENGDIVNSVRHCVRASQPQKADSIVAQAGGIALFLKEGLVRLRAALKLLDESLVSASPRLAVIQCLINVKDGKVFQARCDYDETARRYEKNKAAFSQADCEQIEYELNLMDLILSCYEGKVPSTASCNQLRENTSRFAAEDHATLAYHYNILCFSYMQRGMFKEARYYADCATSEFRLFRSIYGELYINLHQGDICFAEGQSNEAEEHYQTALNFTRKYFNDDKGIKLVAHILIAELKYELNQIGRLPFTLETMPKQLEQREAWFDVYAAGYVTASNIEFIRYGLEAAISILDKAAVYAAGEKLDRLENLLLFQRIDLLLRANEDAQAIDTYNRSCIKISQYYNPDAGNIAWRECDAAVHAVTRLEIKQNRMDEALEILGHFLSYAHNHGHIKSCIRYEILQALAYKAKNDAIRASQHLRHGLVMSRSSNFIRSFIDEGSDVRLMLGAFVAAGVDGGNSITDIQQAQKILQGYTDIIETEDSGSIVSKRELEVLLQLRNGYSNKVIARNINVSENTVRFHLKNIFAKLHVVNRLQAVAVAQEREIF